jgi:hypothetical protein
MVIIETFRAGHDVTVSDILSLKQSRYHAVEYKADNLWVRGVSGQIIKNSGVDCIEQVPLFIHFNRPPWWR